MHGATMNILRKVVHQVGFIGKIIQRRTVNKTQKQTLYFSMLKRHRSR